RGAHRIWHRVVSPFSCRRLQLDWFRYPASGHRLGLLFDASAVHRRVAPGYPGHLDRPASGLCFDDRTVYRRRRPGNPVVGHAVYRRFPAPDPSRDPGRHCADPRTGCSPRWPAGAHRQSPTALAEASRMNVITETLNWLTSASTWSADGEAL